MRIGIDARCIENKRTGLGRYLINLLREWARTAPEHKYVLYFKSKKATDEFLEQECFEQVVLSSRFLPNKGILFQQVLLPWDSLSRDLDLFFAPAYTAPLFLKCKLVVSIHDLISMIEPESFEAITRWQRRIFLPLSAHRATRITTLSQASAEDLFRRYSLPYEKVQVIPLSYDSRFKPVDDQVALESLKRKYRIEANKIMLYVGSIVKRRNVPLLLGAFRVLRNRMNDVHLILVGSNLSYPHIDVREQIDRLRLANDVSYLGHVKDEELVLLYNLADLFLYLSSYEGFGLPVLEAMACGTPVITSNCSSLPEVGGNAALLVNPSDSKQIVEAMSRVLVDKSLARSLRERGLKRVQDFSWETAARQTLEVLHQAAPR